MKRPGYDWLIATALICQSDECLLWPFSKAQCGYGTFMYQKKGHYAHRWVCEKINGAPPAANYHAAHSCGNKGCVNSRHLSWKTNGENQLDRRVHGTQTTTRRKLNPEKVAEIRRLEGIESRLSLAARYGVNEATIRQVQYRKIWKTGQIEPGGFAKVPYRGGRSKTMTRVTPAKH